MKIKEFLNLEAVDELAKFANEMDSATDKLKEAIDDNVTDCLADIDPRVLEARINLIKNQCFFQSWAVMKLNVVQLASQHPDEEIEFLLDKMIEVIDHYTEVMGMSMSLSDMDVEVAEQYFQDALDELEDDEG